MTDAEVKTALSERDVVALTIWAEARSQAVEGRIGVGSVIRNRVLAPRRYGANYRAVCHARWQFSCWEPKGGLANYTALMTAARNLLKGMKPPPVLRECQFLADGLIGGVLLDNVRDSTHYLTWALYVSKPPAWTKGIKPAITLDAHVFFAGVK